MLHKKSCSLCVSGQDWGPEARETYHLGCRVYATPQELRGVEMLRENNQDKISE